MFSRLWSCIKRHRRKFFVVGTLMGGSWMLYRFIWRKIQQIREEEDRQYLNFVKRQHHFESNQRTCNMTVLAMIPNLRDTLVKTLDTENVKELLKMKDTLVKTLDTENVKELLKMNPPNKLDLWEELKIMSFTRTLAAVYGTCMLSVMLRVQLNIVGGYFYLDSIRPLNGLKMEASYKSTIPQKVQERYLSLVKQFIDQGLVDFIHFLRLAVTKEIGCLSLKELISLDNLTSILDHIRERVECGVDKPTQSLYPYLLTSEQVPDISSVPSPEDALLEKLVSETRDILESTDFHTVLKESIDRGYHCVLDTVADHYKEQLSPEDSNSRIHNVSIAVAKLIPVINSIMLRVCGDAPNQFVQELLLMEELKQLAANVYEAFSQDQYSKPRV